MRHSQVEKVESDIKDGMKFDFPWLNNNCNRTIVKPKSLIDTIHLFIDYRLKSENLRPKTIEINQRALDLFIDVVGNIPVKSINLIHIDKFVQYSRSHNHSNHTINIGLRTIRTYLIWLCDRDIIPKVIRIKELQTDTNETKYITEVEFNKLMALDFGHPRFKRMFKLYWETGLRLSETFIGVINGNWLDIPADKSKNHKARSIQINIEQIETIELLQLFHQNNPTLDSIKWYSKKFKKGLLKVGVLDKHFHCMRHSFGARRIIETNGNIHLVRDEMGHSSVTVTERYTRLNRKRVVEDFPSLADKLNSQINGIKDTIIKDTSQYLTPINRRDFN